MKERMTDRGRDRERRERERGSEREETHCTMGYRSVYGQLLVHERKSVCVCVGV